MTRVDIRMPRLPGMGGAFVLGLAVLVIPFHSLHAVDVQEMDFAVVEALNRLDMVDYSLLLLEQMAQRFPDNADRIRIERARTLFSSGQSKQANAELDRIAPSSPAYGSALLLKGEVAALRGRDQDAAEAYAEFFRIANTPDKDKRRAVELYTRAVSVYSAVLKRLGRGSEAADVLERLAGLEGASDRKLAFLKAQAVLDTAEGSLKESKALEREAVERVLEQLAELQYIRDGVAASAYLEMARAHILLAGDELNRLRQEDGTDRALTVDGFRKALETIKMADEAELLRDVESQVIKGKDRSQSPYAGAFFYKAEAYRGLAIAHVLAGDKDKARRIMEAAAKLYETVIANYGESPYRTRALNEHGKCAAFLEQLFDRTIDLGAVDVDAEMGLKLDQAQAFLMDEKFAHAIPIYLEAIRLGRRSPRLPEVVSRLVICLAREGRFLETEALGSYLFDVMPRAEGTAECLFRIGAAMYESAKELTGSAKDDMLLRAMRQWELFVDSAPDHPRAPQVAFAIAEHSYRRAAEVAERAGQTAAADQRDRLRARARDAYLEAIPHYERLVSDYAARAEGIRALYKLGWLYTSTDQVKKSADAFLRYSDSESRPTYADDRLEAKFRAAEQMMLGDNPADAVEQCGELLLWLEPDNEHGFDTRTDTAQRLREDALSYLAWSCDLAAEEERAQLNRIRQRIQELERTGAEAEERVDAAKARLAVLQDEREETAEQFEQICASLSDIQVTFTETALAEAAKRGESSAGRSQAEKAIIEQTIQQEADRLANDMKARARVRAQGQKTHWEQEREQLKEHIRTQAEQESTVMKDLEEARKAAEEVDAALEEASQELASFEESIAAVNKTIVLGESRARDLEEDMQQAKQALADATTAAALGSARDTLRELTEEFEACRADTATAYAKRDELQTDEVQARVQALNAAIPRLETDAQNARQALAEAASRQAIHTLHGTILSTRLKAVAKALDATRAFSEALALEDASARRKVLPELETDSSAARNLFAEAQQLREKRLDVLEESARETMERAGKQRETAAEASARMQEILKPIQQRFEAGKQKAAAAFTRFLETYPESKYVPRNLARLGTVYLELNEFEQAAQILDRLTRHYPGNKATKDALFNLGRAQAEQGNGDEAAQTFTQLLRNDANLDPANLRYIAGRMLDLQQPEASLLASRRIITRSANPDDPHYRELRDKARPQSLLQGGTAALQLGRYEEALRSFETLLEENPRTGFFFEIKFGMAEARRQMQPPNLEGAVQDLGDVIQFSDDPAQISEALVRVGEILAATGERKQVRQAVARFQQVVMLADPSVPGNLPWIEKAIAESAKAFARLGDEDEARQMVLQYRERFPDGDMAADVANLPQAEFAGDTAQGRPHVEPPKTQKVD